MHFETPIPYLIHRPSAPPEKARHSSLLKKGPSVVGSPVLLFFPTLLLVRKRSRRRKRRHVSILKAKYVLPNSWYSVLWMQEGAHD